MEIQTATVSQVTAYIKRVFDSNAVLSNIWIKGEISNFKLHYSGHMYITLKDEGAVMKAVMFKSACSKLDFMPKDGMKVIARGRISVYEPTGAYQLYIDEMKEDGAGDLHVAFEKLKKRLAEEGLFDDMYKKPIPEYPERIGVCTATTGAAVKDIINVITRRFPYTEILVYPTIVQGDGAAPSIVEAISYFNRENNVDVLIVGRGGGSIEDLWGFNEEIVARAIFDSHIPVISAVGHETDFTIADFVADMRAPTPSAAAELAVPSAVELYSKIEMMRSGMLRSINRANENRRLKIDAFRLKSPRDLINNRYLKVDACARRIEGLFNEKIMVSRQKFSAMTGALNALSPLAVMSRGYSVATDNSGNIVKKVSDLNGEFNLRLQDGERKCRTVD